MIDYSEIIKKLSERFSQSAEFVFVEETESTNKIALEYPYEKKDLVFILTSHQSRGRGQRGRTWEDKPGESLLFSIGKKGVMNGSQFLPILAGLVLQDCFGFTHEDGMILKWPNDLLWKGDKLCGILCESQTGAGRDISVIGVGINWLSAPFENSSSVKKLESDMKCSISPGDFLADFIDSFVWELESLSSQDYRSRIIANWEKQSGLVDKKVNIEKNSDPKEVFTVLGLDLNGCLKVRSDSGKVNTLISERIMLI